ALPTDPHTIVLQGSKFGSATTPTLAIMERFIFDARTSLIAMRLPATIGSAQARRMESSPMR
ncbi:hypothetical protein PFISCL1PPCAC_11202, partial [Pristionchus fissidentatus]